MPNRPKRSSASVRKTNKAPIIVTGIIIIAVACGLVFYYLTKTVNDNIPHLTASEIKLKNTVTCFLNSTENVVPCTEDHNITRTDTERVTPIVKKSVALNDDTEMTFLVLNDDSENSGKYLLMLDGFYDDSGERMFEYKKYEEELKSIRESWSHADEVRLLTEKEAKTLGCTDSTLECNWLTTDLTYPVGDFSGIGQYSFYISPDSDYRDMSRDFALYITDQGLIEDELYSSSDEIYSGLRPVVQIDKKYVSD